jgi:hypothetical protein
MAACYRLVGLEQRPARFGTIQVQPWGLDRHSYGRLLAAHAQQGGDMAMTHPLPASTACAGPLQQVENGVPIDQTRCDEFVFRHEFVWLVRHFECAGPKDNSLCTD